MVGNLYLTIHFVYIGDYRMKCSGKITWTICNAFLKKKLFVWFCQCKKSLFIQVKKKGFGWEQKIIVLGWKLIDHPRVTCGPSLKGLRHSWYIAAILTSSFYFLRQIYTCSVCLVSQFNHKKHSMQNKTNDHYYYCDVLISTEIFLILCYTDVFS